LFCSVAEVQTHQGEEDKKQTKELPQNEQKNYRQSNISNNTKGQKSSPINVENWVKKIAQKRCQNDAQKRCQKAVQKVRYKLTKIIVKNRPKI
jgi:hypothetical protein